MKKTMILSVLSTLALAGCQSEEAKVTDISNAKAEDISNTKRTLALQLSESYANIEPMLRKDITAEHINVPLSSFAEQKPLSAFSQQLIQADTQIRAWKGISEYSDQLLEVRLANEEMLGVWQEGTVDPLFAFEPTGDDEQWQYIEAYDVYGQVHQLDVYQLPDVPVLVVDSNSSAELKAGLQAMQAEMSKLGQATMVQPYMTDIAKAQKSLFSHTESTPQPIQTTVLKKIRLANDQEPWISGKAEIYAIVTGVNPTRDEPTLDLVELPYLDYDNTTYLPNQIIIHWSRYRWGAADIVLMEQDDGTDYKQLAKLLVQVAEEVLKAIPDPEVQAYAIIPQITNKIIDAIPDGALTNDDDFVDVYYTLMQDTSYVDHPGAGVNAVATFEPLTINPTRP
ncbi:DUF3103 domain-containing protein [Vibrio sp. MMG022]|uniref:DUF3103 domain-containing protein n=1 Tax=Vibrio TaxID=662 RepID=UPI001F2C98F5|nr:DUF3103 domain-containing protein [Vibrio sp. MMG023]MCF6454421.1 DUF3103 domain-containing protein [Vibrio sp. MMG023]CAH1605529.1 conserved hypothetical protein [Vibrio jasicida]